MSMVLLVYRPVQVRNNPTLMNIELPILFGKMDESNLINYYSFLFQMQLRSTGLPDAQVVEICAALAVLAKYGVISVGLGNNIMFNNLFR